MSNLIKYLLFCLFLIGSSNESVCAQNALPGELLIQFSGQYNPQELARYYTEEQNIKLDYFNCISKSLNVYHVIYSDKSVYLDKEIENWYYQKGVITVQKNHSIQIRETIPSDTLFEDQWHLKNDGSGGGTADADIDATDAWDITTGGLTTHNDSIVVCIIESSGADMTHPDLAGNHWKNLGEIPDDGIDNDGNGYVDDYLGWNVANDNDNIGTGSHGTRVTGMVGAKGDNITGVSGVNWDVKLMIIRGQNASNEASIIEAYSYPLTMRKLYNESNGAEGAFVVVTNASWGIDGGDPADSPLWCAMYDSLGAQGILNIAATTNNNDNVDIEGDLPTTCTSEYLIGVTMSNRVDERAGSGYGTTHVDLAAPGADVRLTTTGGFYTFTTGTSFASPCVAGAVALAYSAPCADFINLVKYDPASAALDMRHYILSSVETSTSLMSEVASGGRLNVKYAIDSLLNACDPNTCIPAYNIGYTNLTDSLIELTWEGFDDDYIVYLQEGTSTPIALPMVTGFALDIDTLKPCTQYTITIVTDCGSGSTSNESYPFSFKTDGCCDTPPMWVESTTETTITLDWDDVLYATGYEFRYREEGTIDWTTLTDVTGPLDITDLTLCTNYEMQVKTICADSTQGFGPTNTFRTKGCGICVEGEYCPVEGAVYSLEWIESVTINDYAYTSGANNGWYIAPGIATALEPGGTYPLTLTPGYSGTAFTERFTIWIDFNQNGVFEDTERVITNETTTSSLSTSMSIPSTAEIGVTKMRIGMAAISPPVPCPTADFYGEFEDYCVYIGGYNAIDEIEGSSEDISVYPNPFQNTFAVQFSSQKERLIEVRDISGKVVWLENSGANNIIIDLSSVENGIYLITSTDEEGNRITERIVKQ